jgi:prolyl oligopeptidase
MRQHLSPLVSARAARRVVPGALLAALLAACSSSGELRSVEYPRTARVDHVDDYDGTKVADPYRWLEDDNSPETAEWVAEENAVTESVLSELPQRDELRERLTELWNYPRLSAPVRRGGAWTWQRNDGLQAQNVVVVAPGPAAEGRVLLDPNAWSSDGTLSLGEDSYSDDGRYVAYGVSEGGSDWRTVRVKDVTTGEDLADQLTWVKFSGPEWKTDGSGFYYGRYPEPEPGAELSASNVNYQIRFHKLGTSQDQDPLIHSNPAEPQWNFVPQVSEDGRWLLLRTWRGSANRNLLHVRPIDSPETPWVALNADWETDADYIGNDGERFYVSTRLDAPRGRVVAIDLSKPEPAAWKTVVPEQPDALDLATIFRDRLALVYMHDAHDRLVLADVESGALQEVELPGIGTLGGLDGRRDNDTVYFTFSSFTQPSSIYALDVASGATRTHWEPELRFDPHDFVTEQVFYSSHDGTRVPMFLVHKQGLRPDGNRPTYLYGYGGFNQAMTPGFNVTLIPFLERGGVFAQPCLRGGSEYGEAWHEAGMLERKQNVFDDFICAAEWLQRTGWTRPEKIAIGGRSNGGLLVGAALTQRPDLFGCAVPGVGVLDMLRYHRFTIGWAWAEEYGSADDPAQFPYLRAYSPLHNVRPGTVYPPTLILTSDHDDRVVPAHSFKFAATLQAAQAGPAPVLIRIETRAGHGAGKPLDMRIAEAADTFAFMLAALNRS